ncbi:hypothetical protein [Cellulomonas edaphi]|uniref:MFS transporter n=1 Tax=Cellulomonas edaphi TaxID=3053468 RepID=A0ABT7S310_9CELL|nr:hypothetical protein [Cellulomons edaphi]MDM7830000.1 hypothetical protein [Cellulomons edaphi]
MVTPTRGALRFARALVVAAVVVALAAGAHVLGGGSLPAGTVTLTLGALVLALCAAVTSHRLGMLGSTALLASGQVGLHAAFSVFEDGGCTALVPSGAHAHMAGAAHSAYLATSGCGSAAAHATLLPMFGAWSMIAAHAIAVLACAAVIAGTDRALMWLVAWLGRRLAPTGVVRLPAWAELPVAAEDGSFERQTWRGVVPLRGPPAWHRPVPPAL